jgi:hypothetical protein
MHTYHGNFRKRDRKLRRRSARDLSARKSLQRRLLHNFTTINATTAQGRAKLHAINQNEGSR